MPTIINGTTGIDNVQDGTITSSDLASGASLANIGAGNITPSYLSTQSQYTGFKNRIINGAMTIAQRGTSSLTQTGSFQYPVDRFIIYGDPTSKFTGQQNAGSVTPPTGFKNYLGITSSSAYSVAASDLFITGQVIEGFNIADLGWGTASASPVTISFWVRSSLTGTFGGALRNGAGNRSYPFTYTINSANTWEYETITIAGDTSGTWASDNSAGISLWFGLGVGSTGSGTAGSWAGSSLFSATGATSVVGTNGATFYITGVQLEKGSTATSFDYRPYGTELALCYRYFYQHFAGGSSTDLGFAWTASSTLGRYGIQLPVTMRASPTLVSNTGTEYYDFYVNGADRMTTSITLVNFTPNTAIIGGTISGASAFQLGVFYTNGAARIGFSSEL